MIFCFFFKQKTAYEIPKRDWSSDVCSSDLALVWSSIFHLIAFGCLSFLFFTTIRTWYAAPFLLLTGVMLWIEQRKASNIELAFFRINAALGFVVFAMIVTGAAFH